MEPWEGIQQIQEALLMIEEALEEINRYKACNLTADTRFLECLIGSRITIDEFSKQLEAMHGRFH